MNHEEFVTEEEIQKAMDELNEETFTSDEEISDIIKADDEDEDEDEESTTNAKTDESDDDDDDAEYKAMKGYKGCYSKGGKYYSKGKDGYNEVSDDEMKAMKVDNDAANGGGDKYKSDVKKGEDYFEVADDDEFEKALEISPVVARLNETLSEVESSTAQKFGSVGTILKGLGEQIASLQDSIDNIGKQSAGRKSVGAQGIERFEKAEGETENDKVVSCSKDRGRMLDLMDEVTFAKGGFDNEMSKAMGYYEANGVINTATAVRIEKETGYRVVQ
ncbi:hypothetical protein N8508_00020 [bacterium]|nr:hypothetical protein [bacterium]